MEPEASLPCSQEPSTGPNPEPDQSNQSNPILSLHNTWYDLKIKQMHSLCYVHFILYFNLNNPILLVPASGGGGQIYS
jgi:hypothetical protein